MTPDNSVLLLTDFQAPYAFSTQSISIDALLNNTVGLTEAAKAFKVPTVITTMKGYAGTLIPQIQQAAGTDIKPIERTQINAWQDVNVRNAIHGAKRKKLVIAGLWLDSCVMLPALAALSEGYEVYVVTDASGDPDVESHERAVQRLVQAGAVPITWLPILLEWQADWTQNKTNGAIGKIIAEHAGAMGLTAFYNRSISKP
ncbi:Isochorismatase family protein [Pseudomonas chlororaphis]|uniref:Isochorismatase family protein n=1 Tax=Pseudomonas chlororaphis TaxID=587753 RepID=A0A3G7TVB9_9PSED|nr:Isochorismatase family protein [Pseudomonas chlororaphis]